MSKEPQKPSGPISGQAQYIVISKGDNTDCRLIPADEPFQAVYHKVYGPASEEKCRAWMAENCRELA